LCHISERKVKKKSKSGKERRKSKRREERTGSREVDFTKDVGHASLVSHEGSQMGLLLSIVTRESSDAATDGGGSLAREKPERSF
jgi:hypothetical protein